jgi:hypothetical protein
VKKLRRCATLIAVCLTIALGMGLGIGSSVASATPPAYTWNWEFSYSDWNGTSTPGYTQLIGGPLYWTAYRWWPAPGYSTSSKYFRLLPSLDQYGLTWKDSIRWAAGRWSEQDPMFHFYELPPNGNNFDGGIGMAHLGGPVATTFMAFEPSIAGRKATINAYYMRFNADIPFTDGIYPSTSYDRGSCALHELGHTLGLRDVWGDWGLGYSRPTMHYMGLTGSVDTQSLVASPDVV